MNSHPKKYQDYVIKNGKLVGDFEGLYKDVEDPWNQSRDDHLNDYRRQIAILGCQRLREKFSCNQVLELGCGFGFIADQLRTLGFTCCGTDISQTAILKANIIHPLTQFKCSPYNNLHLINELKPMIEEIGDATLIVPLIKEYMEIGVKNDDLLIKMAALAQRAMNSESTDAGLGISDEEKQQLLDEISKFKSEE